jgi:metallophosphoesterase superfamily enzyme
LRRSFVEKVYVYRFRAIDWLTNFAPSAVEQVLAGLLWSGDFKHNVTGPSTLETELIPRQLRRMKEVFEDIVIIPGNHDGRLEDVVKDFASVAPARGLVLEEEVGLTHGHVKARRITPEDQVSCHRPPPSRT